MGLYNSIFLFFYRRKIPSLVLVFVLIALSFPGIMRVRIDTSLLKILSMKGSSHSLTREKTITSLILIKSQKNHVVSKNFIRSLSSLVRDIKKNNPKYDIDVFTNVKILENREVGFGMEAVLPSVKNEKIDLNDVKNKMLQSKYIMNFFVSKNFSSTVVYVDYSVGGAKDQVRHYHQLKTLIDSYKSSFKSIQLLSAGEAHHSVMQNIKDEFPTIMVLALVVMMLFVYLIIRDVRLLIVTFIIVLLNLYFSFSVIGYIGWKLDLISVSAPLLILIIGSTECLHLVCAYQKGMVKHKGCRDSAVEFMVKKVYQASIVTALTTAMGFYSFYFSSSMAMYDFGLAIGSAMVVCALTTLFFLPVMIASFFNENLVVLSNLTDTGKLKVSAVVDFMLRNKKYLLLIVVFVFFSSVFMLRYAEVDFPVSTPFVSSHPFSQKVNHFSQHLGGLDIATIKVKSSEVDSMIKAAVLDKLDKFTSLLEKEKNIKSSYGLTDLIKNINLKIHDNNLSYYRIPKSDALIEQLMFAFSSDALSEFINSDCDQATFTLLVHVDHVSDIVALRKLIKRKFSESFGKGYTIEFSHPRDDFSQALTILFKESAGSLVLCLFTIFIMFCLYFRSLLSGTLALFVNMMPLIMLLSFMSMLDIPIDPAGIGAFIIVLSVGVDDTIHYFVKYSEFARNTDNNLDAVKKTFHFEVTPVTATSLSVFLSMLVLTFSSIRSIQIMGFLCSVGLAFCYIGDMVINTVVLSSFRIVTAFDMLAFRYDKTILKNAPIFKGLSYAEIKKAVLMSRVIHLARDDQLMEFGASGTSMYVILDGQLEVFRDNEKVATLQPGNVVGELAYFTREKRSADVFAKGAVTLVSFSKESQEHSLRYYKRMYIKLLNNVISIVLSRYSKT